MTEPLILGAIVEHRTRPDWGPGKILHIANGKAHIIFRDLGDREAKVIDPTKGFLRLAELQSDPFLDSLPPIEHANGRIHLAAGRLTPTTAVERFRQRFPGGFADPNYIGSKTEGEREYKWRAHEKFVGTLGNGQLAELLENGDTDEAIRRALSVVGSVNLLASFEAAALRDALQDPGAAAGFLRTLNRVLGDEAVSPVSFSPYLEAVRTLPQKQGRVATWPVATILPYLARPDRHMFLKPERTKEAADAMGFDLRYDATPNWRTYEALLRFSEASLALLREIGARDFIDVQSFFFVVSSEYGKNRARWEEKYGKR